MTPDPWFVKELKLISPRYSVKWNSRKSRWQIWFTPQRGKPFVLETVAHYEDGEDLQVRDVGFHPLDRRVLLSVKRSARYSENPEVALMEVDEANAALEAQGEANEDLALRDLRKSLGRHFGTGRHPDTVQPNHVTVDLGA